MAPKSKLDNAEEDHESSSQKNNQQDDDAATGLTETSLRDRMLDIFPLSGEELDHALKCFENCKANSTFDTLVQGVFTDDDASRGQHLQRLRYAEATFIPEAARLLRQAYDDALVVGSGHDEEAQFKFLEALSSLIGRRSPNGALQTIYRVAGSEDTSMHPTAEELVGLVYRLILAAHYVDSGRPRSLRSTPASWIDSLSQKVANKDDVSEAEWIAWVNSIAPQTHQALSTFAHCALFAPKHPFRPTNPPLRFPLTDQECALWSGSFQTVPSSIAILSPQLGGKWIRQYSSDVDGFSFSTFQQALVGYQGHTAILIQTTAGDAFGYYSGEPWRESRQWFGQEADAFLFGLKPSLQYYGPTVNANRYGMYLYNPAIRQPGQLCGLCVGGVAEKSPRIHITTSFEKCMAQPFDGSFDMGPLLSDHHLYFDIDVIEIWAVNVKDEDYFEALSKGRALQEFREVSRLHAAKVDRRLFLEDFQEGIFGTSLFKHRQQARGRHSFVAGEDEGMGYFIEKKPPTSSPHAKKSRS